MAQPSSHEMTQLLRAWNAGDKQALEHLMPLMYEELHRLAARCMAEEQEGHVLQTTALVHEVYIRLVDVDNVDWRDRAHFFALSARLMRRILTIRSGAGMPRTCISRKPLQFRSKPHQTFWLWMMRCRP